MVLRRYLARTGCIQRKRGTLENNGEIVTRRVLFGATICDLTRRDLVEKIAAAPSTDGVRLVATMNLDHVVSLRNNMAFRRAYAGAWAVTIDGAPIFLYGLIRDVGAPERITGADLLADLAKAWPLNRRLFFVAASAETGQSLVEHFVALGFSRDALSSASPPFGFEHDEARSETLCAQIRDHRTTDLLFGVGAPKSEVWIDAHRRQLGDLYAFGMGAGLDFLVGQASRAPRILRGLGLEWAWRLGQEPRRLWRRYLIQSWGVLPSVAADLAGRAPHGGARLDE